MITQEELKELLEYKEDGHLYWIVKKYRRNTDIPAGNKNNQGYQYIRINNKLYAEHRLVWLYFDGKWPLMIDHIDQNKTNNKIENLRETNNSQNMYNVKPHKGSTSKYVGVCWSKIAKRWDSRISVNGKSKHLGYFKNEIDAAKRRDEEIIKVGCQYCTLNVKKENKK